MTIYVDILLTTRQRLVPIINPQKNNAMVGVITRTDVVKILMEDPSRIPVLQKKRENVKALMQRFGPLTFLPFLVTFFFLEFQRSIINF